MSHKETYTCEQCGQGWEDLRGVDTRECSREGCQVVMCEQCYKKCWSCEDVLCNDHLVPSLDGPECVGCELIRALCEGHPDEDKHEGHSSQCNVREESGWDECDCGFEIAEAARRAKAIVDEAVKP